MQTNQVSTTTAGPANGLQTTTTTLPAPSGAAKAVASGRKVLAILRRHWYILLVCAGLGALGGYIYNLINLSLIHI